MECSWEDAKGNIFGLCEFVKDSEYDGEYCDTECLPFDGRFEWVEYEWDDYEDCVWDNVDTETFIV